MLIDLKGIVSKYNLNIKGVIHIGAHYGQEYMAYNELGVTHMMLFEPVKANFNKLSELMPKNSDIKLYNLALGNHTGKREMYIETAKGQSCSLLEPGTHLELHPHIVFSGMEMVEMERLDDIKFDHALYNMINIDVQGYELEVFKGAMETLRSINIIYTEVNFEQVYKGCCQVEELDRLLSAFGFKRVLTKDCGARRNHKTWGDALYLK